MFQEELAISDLPETYCRKSKEQAFLRVAGKLCVHLQLPSICGLLLRSSDFTALAPYYSLSSVTVSTLPPLTASPVLRYPLSEMPTFFLNCPFIMPPPHKVSKKPCLSPGIIKHMWRMLTCKGCSKSSSFLSDRNS